MEKKSDSIDALDLGKVIDLSKLIIKPNHVLIEIVELTKSNLLLPTHLSSSVKSKAVIYKVGETVKGYSAGDIVLDINYNNVEFITQGDNKYILCDVYNVVLATSPDNYKED